MQRGMTRSKLSETTEVDSNFFEVRVLRTDSCTAEQHRQTREEKTTIDTKWNAMDKNCWN